MNRFCFCPVLLLSWVSAVQGAQAQSFDDVIIKTTQVAGNVYMLEGRGGNIGVSVGADGLLIVDDQFAPLADKIREALGKLGGGQVEFVLNTHWHPDHTGGNAAFGADAPIIAHENVRKRLSSQQQVLGRTVEPSPGQALPVITFDAGLRVYFNNEVIRIIHHPHSHTDGDSVIFFMQSNVVHMGDLFFAGQFPFVDLGSGGSVEGLIQSVGAVIKAMPEDVKVIPGHGPLSTLQDLRDYHDMLVQTAAIVRKRMHEGQTLEQVQALGLPDRWRKWSASFIDTTQWLAIVYSSLQASESIRPMKESFPPKSESR